jgi:integrase
MADDHGARMPGVRGRPSASFPPEARRLRPELWPAADREAWARATTPSGPLDPPSPAAHLRPATRDSRAGAWGRYLSFLAAHDQLDPAEATADRLTPERLGLWIGSMRDRVSAHTVHRLVLDLSFAIAAMVPERDWGWVRRHPARPRHAEVVASRKPVAPFDAPRLVEAALGLCARADAAPPSPEAARDYRDGLLLALAAYTGLRRANLAAIRIGESLVQHDGGGFRLTFEGPSLKTGGTLDVPVPEALVPHLRRHLEVHRPLLLAGRPDHGLLWVGRAGRPLSYTWLYNLFVRRGRELLGRPVNPHAARHAIATGLLAADPRAVGVAGAALAHSGARSVTEVYDRSGRAGAETEWRRLSKQAVRAGR